MNIARRDFPQLDAMRAVASIAVVATHAGFWSGFYTSGYFGVAVQRLEVGVAIFFVLSGFLLSRSYLVSAHDRVPHEPARRYFTKRVLRILPVYVVAVVAALTLISENRSLSVDRWVQNLLLVDLYREDQLPQGLTQMWSLTVEVAFYLILPLLGAFLIHIVCLDRWRPGRLLAFLALVIVGSVAWVLVTHSVDSALADQAARWLPSYASWFALGIGLTVLTIDASAPGRVTAALIAAGRDRASCWLAAGAIFLIVATPLGGSPLLVSPTPAQAVVRHVCYGLIAVLAVAPCVLGDDRTPVARVLALPAIRHLGHISYALFCCHVTVLAVGVPAMGFTVFNTPFLLLFSVILAISLVVAEVLYRVVERPFMSLAPGRRARTPSTTPSDSAAHS